MCAGGQVSLNILYPSGSLAGLGKVGGGRERTPASYEVMKEMQTGNQGSRATAMRRRGETAADSAPRGLQVGNL